MMANDWNAVVQGVEEVLSQTRGGGDYSCHICGCGPLTEDALHRHNPLFHSCEAEPMNPEARWPICPICGKTHGESGYRRNFAVHLHNHHGPVEDREPHFPSLAAFTWIVCRRPDDGRFLMVHEPAPIAGGAPNYWLPAGRVDAGETFVKAGVRETLEEAGVEAVVTGVLRFQLDDLTPRIILYAEPVSGDQGGSVAKSVPDFESVGALWVRDFCAPYFACPLAPFHLLRMSWPPYPITQSHTHTNTRA